MRDRIFYIACAGFGVGVLWRSFLPFENGVALALLASATVLAFVSKRKQKEVGVFISIFVLTFAIGIVRFYLADVSESRVFENEIGQMTSLSGVITNKPEESENGTQLTVSTVQNGQETTILVFAKKGEPYQYGDTVSVNGKITRPDNFTTAQQKEFDYVNYLKKDGILYVMKSPAIEVTASGGGNVVSRDLYALRDRIDEALNTAIPNPESAFMKGLILGEKSSLGTDLKTAFINTGLVHVITLSGYNITIVAEWIMKSLSFLPLLASTSLGMLGIILFILMTGAASTAIRAGIMAGIALLAKITKRKYDAGRALVLAGVVMVFLNPLILAFDISFQLSFIATVAVLFLAPKLEIHFAWITWPRLRETVALTVAAYVFVLPFILYKMGNWSLVALPTNFAILPFVPLTMIAGLVVSIAGLLSPLLSLVPGEIAYLLLHGELATVTFFSHIPFSSLTVPEFPLISTLVIYALFFYYLFGEKITLRFGSRTRALGGAILLTILTAGFFTYQHYQAGKSAQENMQMLFSSLGDEPFTPDMRTKSAGCLVNGSLQDRACTPGAIFPDGTLQEICVKGYTKRVRSVSQKTREKVFAEYGIAYPQPKGAYEVDHLIPLAVGGSNDMSNLFPEAATPTPGFHDKDVVEVYLQQEVCAGHVSLSAAQTQIAENWLLIWYNLTPEQIQTIRNKYPSDNSN